MVSLFQQSVENSSLDQPGSSPTIQCLLNARLKLKYMTTIYPKNNTMNAAEEADITTEDTAQQISSSRMQQIKAWLIAPYQAHINRLSDLRVYDSSRASR